MSNRVRHELVGYEPQSLGGRSIEGHGLGVEDERHLDVLHDPREKLVGANVLSSRLAEQPMHCRQRANPRRGEIERLAGAAGGTSEQKQVRGGLEAVLDPVLCLGE